MPDVINRSVLNDGLNVLLPTFRYKEASLLNPLGMGGTHWRSLAHFGTVIQCNALPNRVLLCEKNFNNGFMLKRTDISGKKMNSLELFSLLHLIRPAGRIFVFTRTRQVVF